MPRREGLTLLTFSLLASLGHRWNFAGLRTIPPDWGAAVVLIGLLGLSVLLVSIVRSALSSVKLAGDKAFLTAPPPRPPEDPAEEPTQADRLRESGLVDADWYSKTYPDIASAGLEAADHYFHHGAIEGRNPNAFFDTNWYLDRNPDVREAAINPLIHYLNDGISEGRAAGPKFDTAFYQSENADVAASGMNPLAHYLREGRSEGRRGIAKG